MHPYYCVLQVAQTKGIACSALVYILPLHPYYHVPQVAPMKGIVCLCTRVGFANLYPYYLMLKVALTKCIA